MGSRDTDDKAVFGRVRRVGQSAAQAGGRHRGLGVDLLGEADLASMGYETCAAAFDKVQIKHLRAGRGQSEGHLYQVCV